MSENAASDVHITREGSVLTMTLNRPARRNALTYDAVGELIAAVRAAAADDETRVLVLRAAGEHFCTGMDLEASNRTAGGARPRAGHLQRRMTAATHRLIRELCEVQLPVVAGVQGWAAGFGCMLGVSADVVLAAGDARFWIPFVRRGMSPDSGSTFLLPRLIGLSRAKEMVLRGKPIDAERAASWGLISEVVSDLDAAVAEAAEELAAAATVAVGLGKTLLHRNLSAELGVALEHEAVYEELAVRSADFQEGMRAFAEKRDPHFTGW